jgi:hypothetical protein
VSPQLQLGPQVQAGERHFLLPPTHATQEQVSPQLQLGPQVQARERHFLLPPAHATQVQFAPHAQLGPQVQFGFPHGLLVVPHTAVVVALVAARAFAVGRFRTRAGDCVAGRFNHGGLRIEGDRHGGNARDRGEGGLYRSGAAAADHIGVDFQIMGRHDLDAGRSRGKDAFVCEARNGKGHIHATPQFNALSGELRRRLMQYIFYVGSSFPSGFFFEVRLCLGWTPGRRSKLYSDFSLVRTCYLWTVKIRCNPSSSV